MRIRLVVTLTMAALAVLALSGGPHEMTAVVSGQGTGAAPAPHPSSEQAADMAEVLTLDQKIGNAVVRGDTAYVASMTSSDFIMVHGDGWTTGGQPLSTDTQDSMLRRVTSKHYDVIDFDSIKAEMHGDIAITYGHYVPHVPSSAAERAWLSVWFERVFAKRNGRWIYVSHRTVHGPTYGADRVSIKDK
ncbi:MAG: nuclear transport factor 2 family protein [Vicinamibacterales bacterium]